MQTEGFKLEAKKFCECSEDEKDNVARIKRCFMMMNRKKCPSSNVFVGCYTYATHDGIMKQATLVCLCTNLPDGPVIRIPKPVGEVTCEDVIKCYKLVNQKTHTNGTT